MEKNNLPEPKKVDTKRLKEVLRELKHLEAKQQEWLEKQATQET